MSDPHFDATNHVDANNPQHQQATTPPSTPPKSTLNSTPNNTQQKPHLFQHITAADYQAAGTSFGIGLASALILALLTALTATHSLSSIINRALDSPSFALFPQDQTSSLLQPITFVQNWILALALGLSGDLNFTTTMPYGLHEGFISGSAHIPITLVAIALVIGAAFGSYLFAHKARIPFLWRGIIGSACVGITTGLVVLILAVITRVAIAVTPFRFTIDGFTIRTAIVSILLASGGSCIGYYLADRVPDAPHLFIACWRWAHRTRGSMRTCIETATIFTIAFTIANLIASVVIAMSVHNIFVIPLMLLLLPALILWEIPIALFGGISIHLPPQINSMLSICNDDVRFSFGSYTWVAWLMFVVSLLCIFYIALRAGARNGHDPRYAHWQYSWQAPVFWFAFWLIIPWLFASIYAQYSGLSVQLAPAVWFSIVSAVWAFLIEVVARLLAPRILPAITQGQLTSQQKLIIVIVSIATGLIIILSITFAVINARVFSASAAAQTYITAIENGDFEQANTLGPTHLDPAQAPLLTNKAAPPAGKRITNARVVGEQDNDGGKMVTVSYTLNNKPITRHIRMVKQGHKSLIFTNWIAAQPLLSTIEVTHSAGLSEITVNNVALPAKHTITSDESTGDESTNDESAATTISEFAAYPGVYTVSAPQSRYYRAGQYQVDVGISDSIHGTVSLATVPSQDLADAINTQIKQQFDSCKPESNSNPAFCPLGSSMVTSGDYKVRNVQWSITRYPKVTPATIFLADGSFRSNIGMVTVSYEDEFLGHWYSHKGPRLLSTRGSFTIEGDTVHVQLASDEDE